MRKLLCSIFLMTILFVQSGKGFSQGSEIGFSLTISGHLLFGPYYRYWINDHNSVDATLLASFENKLIFPHGLSAGYKYYFLDDHWRPSLGLQYTFMTAPVKEEGKRPTLQLFSLVPGIQYRWNENHLTVEEFLWISYLNINNKKKILPLGLETRFGYHF